MHLTLILFIFNKDNYIKLLAVGPAETLTRGTLQPPSQVSPAYAAMNLNHPQPLDEEWVPMGYR